MFFYLLNERSEDKKMAIEDVFKGAKSAFCILYTYQNAVIRELGIERALALQTELSELIGTGQGRMLMEQLMIKGTDAIAAIPMIENLKENIGESFEIIEKSAVKVVMRNGRCPFYEAAQMIGMDNKAIMTFCQTGSIRIADAVVRQLNPKLSLRVRKFRKNATDACEEELFLS
jgi:hypothetical protein